MNSQVCIYTIRPLTPQSRYLSATGNELAMHFQGFLESGKDEQANNWIVYSAMSVCTALIR